MALSAVHLDSQAINLVGQEKYQEAADCWTEAILLSPTSGSNYSNRGRCYLFLKRYEEALADCQKAIELGYTSAYGYINRGRAYAALEDYEKAIEDCNIAIEKIPNALCYCERGKVYLAMGEKTKAIEDFNKAMEAGKVEGVANNNYVEKIGKEAMALASEALQREDI